MNGEMSAYDQSGHPTALARVDAENTSNLLSASKIDLGRSTHLFTRGVLNV
jgi:hypothetical protein